MMLRSATGKIPDAALQRDAVFSLQYRYRLHFTGGVFKPANTVLADVLRTADVLPVPALVFVDQGVAAGWPELKHDIATYARAYGDVMRLAGAIRNVPGGETCKNDPGVLRSIMRDIHDASLCRHSCVIVIGGGAVLDVVGFAAATVHRGIRLLRLPTTTLSQADSGVGVKNGINLFGKKNYLGTFSVPWAVINDVQFLSTLSDRDWRCGFSESVKVALMKERAFFDCIAGQALRLRQRHWEEAVGIIQHSCDLHFGHIVEGGDPFELNEARPLDFGHWAAHKLEQLTGFELQHGEAVAIGVALDVTYSALRGHLSWGEVHDVHGCLRDLGFALYHDKMSHHDDLLTGLDEFREHLGGRLTIPLLERIGGGFLAHEIDRRQMCAAIDYLATHLDRNSPMK